MEEQNQQQPTPQPEKSKKKLYKKWWFWVIIILVIIGAVMYCYYPQVSLKNTEGKYGSSVLKIDGVFNNTEVHWDFRETGIVHHIQPNSFFGRLQVVDADYSNKNKLDMDNIADILTTLVNENSTYSEDCSEIGMNKFINIIPIAQAQVSVDESLRACSNSRYYFDVTFDNCVYSAYKNYCAYIPKADEEGTDNFIDYIDSVLVQIEIPTINSVYNDYFVEETDNNF